MKVLIAEDEAVSRRLLQAALTRWGYEVVTASDGCAALEILQQPDAPKLVVFDWMMPGLDGMQLCQAVRAKTQEPYTYILMVTAKRAQENVVAGLTAGADDYITKPFDPDELRVRLRTGKRIVCLQDQLIAARESLRDAATHDSLTRLWNRPPFSKRSAASWPAQTADHGSVGVVMLDLDNFKRVNDTHGHQVGDEALIAVAKTLRSSVRPYDSIGRVGGEEFLVVLPGCNELNAMSHAERLRAAISELVIPNRRWVARDHRQPGRVGRRHPTKARNACVRAADDALYVAKRNGRNRVEFQNAQEIEARSAC